MKKKLIKRTVAFMLVAATTLSLTACGGRTAASLNTGEEMQVVDLAELQFPLAEKKTLTGMISYPANTEPNPNNRTVFKRLQEATNVEIEWMAIQSDQWGDKIALNMSNPNLLTDFVFTANFNDNDLHRYAKYGAIIPLEEYIDAYMPNLCAVFEKYPEYKKMSTSVDGHIWALPWIEQLGSGKTAIQSVSEMPFINKKWLDFLGLEMPETVDEFEQTLIAFRDHASELQQQFSIEGSIIPMSCIVNDGSQDMALLINGFGEGYGDGDQGRHIAVTD
ncbi:MAG: extracellular solute-binding protein, partial [Lachnospiraceae bacterium]|nr:extracellular solute-binding protein [Lachnospiraceae bacterium]